MLLDESDVYLVALLVPLADCADELSDEEMQKLPLRLQYYEGTRDASIELRKKLVEALYQVNDLHLPSQGSAECLLSAVRDTALS